MPKVPIDYSNTIMYKIVCKNLNVKELYVGHTVNFRSRKNKHASDCNNENARHYHIKIYTFIRDNGGWDNWEMIEIEKYNCNDGNEARARERYWYEQLEAKLNHCYPGRSDEEYNLMYKEQNKEKIKERRNKKYNCECEGRYIGKNKYLHFRSIKHKTFILNQELEKNKQEQ